MIEIVYDEEREKFGDTGRKKYELPKNIRQVGNAPGNYKIYIEDYVMTYLRKLAAPGNMTCRGAILLGRIYRQDGEKVMFISGAVDAQNLEFDISMISFNDSVWSSLYSEINKYFDDLVIVGWFLSRMGFSTNINDQMKKLHRDNFPGDDKILFLMDSLECDEAFYYYENGSLVREKGYYIYYVRNEKMQNYIISRKNDETESKRDAVVIKDKTVVETFREKERSRSKDTRKGRGGFGRTVAGIGVVCAVSLGALWYVSPTTFDRLGNAVLRKNGGEVQVFMNSADVKSADETADTINTGSSKWDMSAQQTDTQDGDEQTSVNTGDQNGIAAASGEMQGGGQTDRNEQMGQAEQTQPEELTSQGGVQPESSDSTENAADAIAADSGQNIYTVEAGDTLVSIAIKMYGDQTKADYIAAVNELDIDTPIYEGQKIVIPYIE